MGLSARPLIIKVGVQQRRRADRIGAVLARSGFQVINATSIKDGIRMGERAKPTLILTIENTGHGIDGEQWLEAQHASPTPHLAMVPLVILAESGRLSYLRIHELPGRVKVFPVNIHPDRLSDEIQQLLTHLLF